jgi:hypothetical protein
VEGRKDGENIGIMEHWKNGIMQKWVNGKMKG